MTDLDIMAEMLAEKVAFVTEKVRASIANAPLERQMNGALEYYIERISDDVAAENEYLANILHNVKAIMASRIHLSTICPAFPENAIVEIATPIDAWKDAMSKRPHVGLRGTAKGREMGDDGIYREEIHCNPGDLGYSGNEPIRYAIPAYFLKEVLDNIWDEQIRDLYDGQPAGGKTISRIKDFMNTIGMVSRANGEETPYYLRVKTACETEITTRLARARNGSKFKRGDRVRIIEHIHWWTRATSAVPPVGIEGRVLASKVNYKGFYKPDPDEYVGSVPVRFLATDLGYLWEEGDNIDRKYVTLFVPNYAMELAV